jgi:hypothetical protein
MPRRALIVWAIFASTSMGNAPSGAQRLTGLGGDVTEVYPAGDGNGTVAGTTRPFDMTVLSFWIYESFG